MAQENDTDLSTKFSTLNVNAMEFVPSFCVQQSTTTTATATAALTEVLAANTPENPGSYSFKPESRSIIHPIYCAIECVRVLFTPIVDVIRIRIIGLERIIGITFYGTINATANE